MYQASEVVDLIMVVALTPLLAAGLRTVTFAGKPWFVGAYAGIAAAFIFTVAEGYALPDLFNLFEHAGYAVCGICMAVGVRTFVLEDRLGGNDA